ncbi:MAG: ComF family protein [Clostridiales bacterium]|nr:ComF family protein [Clostridiales bacterium]
MSLLLKKAVNLLLPQARCLACDEPRRMTPGEALCTECQIKLEQLRIRENVCDHCLSPTRFNTPCAYCAQGGMVGIRRAYAPYVYRDITQKLIVRLKFGGAALAAKPLADEMALCVSGMRFDAMVPVPLYKTQERERGFNQSRLLCDIIHEHTGIPVLNALQKMKKTVRQSSLPPEKRTKNVQGAFGLAIPVTGMEILLVDDVRTTGASVRECARVLMISGAEAVYLLTAAIANPRRNA